MPLELWKWDTYRINGHRIACGGLGEKDLEEFLDTVTIPQGLRSREENWTLLLFLKNMIAILLCSEFFPFLFNWASNPPQFSNFTNLRQINHGGDYPSPKLVVYSALVVISSASSFTVKVTIILYKNSRNERFF